MVVDCTIDSREIHVLNFLNYYYIIKLFIHLKSNIEVSLLRVSPFLKKFEYSVSSIRSNFKNTMRIQIEEEFLRIFKYYLIIVNK